MNKDEFIRYVSSELEHGRDIDLEYQINGIPYKIKFLATDMNKGINIPCILAIPLSENTNGQLVVEANNLESENFQETNGIIVHNVKPELVHFIRSCLSSVKPDSVAFRFAEFFTS